MHSNAPFSIKSSPHHERKLDYFSQPKDSPEKQEDQKDLISKSTKKTRATTQHRERVKTYQKKLDVRDQNVKQGAGYYAIGSKRKRLLTGKPARQNERNAPHIVEPSNNSDLNFSSNDHVSRDNVTSVSGYGLNAFSKEETTTGKIKASQINSANSLNKTSVAYNADLKKRPEHIKTPTSEFSYLYR